MEKPKRILPIVVVSYIIVIAVNIIGNYKYYAAGNSWHFSVLFSLGMTTFCWLFFSLLGFLIFKRLKFHDRPTFRILLASTIFAIAGAGTTILVIKCMVWFFGFPEQSVSDYISTCTYSALFSMIIGLMITAQQSLIHLKKNIEDNELMKQEMIRSQYETLKNQVNPHFLFNSLNTLTVMIPQQPGLAVNFVEQMAKVFRYSLQHSDEPVIDVASELKVVRSYLFLNEQRFDGKLKVDISIDSVAEREKIITQSLLMLVENAIKHNEISMEHPLSVSIYCAGNYLVVKNTLQRKSILEQSTNMGLENIKKRYALVSDKPVTIEQDNNLFVVKIPLLK